MTPRKTQRRYNNHSQNTPVPVQTSDYDSEVFQKSQSPSRAPEKITLTVLQRYVPSLLGILSRAPSAQIYTFSRETETWEKANIEGTMFIGKLTPSPITGCQRHCIIVLNRKGLENLIIESGEIENVEVTEDFLLLEFRTNATDNPQEKKAIGFFIFADPEIHSKEYICQLVKEHMEMAKMDRYRSGQQEAVSYDDEVQESIEIGAARPLGRRISLSELFGAR
jgi:hypothetical protein